MSQLRSRLHSLLGLVAFFAAGTAMMVSKEAGAANDGPIAVGEISQVSPPSGAMQLDPVLLRAEAEGEIKMIDASRLPTRRVVVSLALTRTPAPPADGTQVVVCTVNAMLRDARTGAMIAIIEAGAQAEGSPVSLELRKQVANAAIRRAVRRIPRALGAKQ